jgi:putative transposase
VAGRNEGAKFWLNVLTELKNRGLNDILIACVDGLKGFPEAINAVYPETQIQLCIVHMARNSLRFLAWKDYKAVTRDLKQVYRAATEEGALQALDAFEGMGCTVLRQISLAAGGQTGRMLPPSSSCIRRRSARLFTPLTQSNR